MDRSSEAKEAIAGVVILDVDSDAAALEIAKSWPGRHGYRIEVRLSRRRPMRDASQALARYFRDEAGRLVASLTRQLGDFDLAEESVQDAIVEALRTWPMHGVPDEPGAWVRVAARPKATDRLSRSATQKRYLLELTELDLRASGEDGLDVVGDRLVLLFMCCHPALSREAQVALVLRSLLGLTTAQIAKAFLTTEATMAKRIVRAKRKVTERACPWRCLPEPAPRLGFKRSSCPSM